MATLEQPDHEVAIVGAGFGGIGAAIALQKAGVDDLIILDKWSAVGGTWLANTYPGVAVDIPAFIYSFSYEQRSDWSRLFAPGDEIRRYAEDVVDRHGLRPKLRLSTTIERCVYDETQDLWRVSTENGDTITARFLVPAIGGLERPKLPDIEGIDGFDGTVMHTAAWDHDADLFGKRVGVIGTGATALQLVPELAKTVSQLSVFQRTPIWVSPKVDFEIGPVGRFVLSRRPIRSALRMGGAASAEFGLGGLMFLPEQIGGAVRHRAEASLRRWMRSQVDDPEVRDALIPTYGLGCKRPSMSNTYLRTFNDDHVSLVTETIERVEGKSVMTTDGADHELDVLVCATGFEVMAQNSSPPFPVVGRGGVDIRDFWHENRFQAYQGVSVPGWPNVFMVTGPTGFVIGSYFWMVEATSAHLARVIAEARRRQATHVEVRQAPHDEYFQRCLDRSSRSFLFSEDCADANSYYINYQGDASVLRPSTHAEMYIENRFFPMKNYRFDTRPRPSQPASARPTAKPVDLEQGTKS